MDINIVAGKDKDSSRVTVSGSVQHVITDEERVTFSLGDNELKQAVESNFGRRPNDAYLHSPTPWDDLYKRYSWPQVQTVLVPQSAEILKITSEPTIVKTQKFQNNSSEKATFNVSITESLSQTASTNWSTSGSITVGQKFTYKIGFLGTGAGGETSLSYQRSWGKGGSNSKTITVGSSAGVQVELDPGEAVAAQLSASRGTMKVQIRYRAYLIGDTAVNYNPRHRGHHFWALDIGDVMSSASKSNSSESIENIEIGYYSNGKIELQNLEGSTVKNVRMLLATGNQVPGLQ